MFIGKYDGRCEFCGDQTKGAEITYAHDRKIVHVAKCLVPYNAGVRRGLKSDPDLIGARGEGFYRP